MQTKLHVLQVRNQTELGCVCMCTSSSLLPQNNLQLHLFVGNVIDGRSVIEKIMTLPTKAQLLSNSLPIYERFYKNESSNIEININRIFNKPGSIPEKVD